MTPESRFNIERKVPDERDEDADVVSGEIGVERGSREEVLASLEREYAEDALVAALFDRTAQDAPLARVGNLLDLLLEERRSLEASDAEPSFKEARADYLSKLMNRLRELL